jgi:hypothetical protein
MMQTEPWMERPMNDKSCDDLLAGVPKFEDFQEAFDHASSYPCLGPMVFDVYRDVVSRIVIENYKRQIRTTKE